MQNKSEKKFKDPKVKGFSLNPGLKCLDFILDVMEKHHFSLEG